MGDTRVVASVEGARAEGRGRKRAKGESDWNPPLSPIPLPFSCPNHVRNGEGHAVRPSNP